MILLAAWSWVIIFALAIAAATARRAYEQHRARDPRARVRAARAPYPAHYAGALGSVPVTARARGDATVAFVRARRARLDAGVSDPPIILPESFVKMLRAELEWLEAPPVSRDEAPTIGYAVGWRSWKVGVLPTDFYTWNGLVDGDFRPSHLRTPVLLSVTRSAYWSTSEPLEADEAPRAGSSHGIYAHKDLEHLFADDDVVPWYLYGPVALWGRTVETERGWKAQYAYPLALFGLTSTLNTLVGSDPQLAALSARYRVPWASINLEAVADTDAWPAHVVAELREHTGSWVAKGLLPAGVRV